MKPILAVCSLLLTATFAFADVTINLTAGELSFSNGNPIPSGSLLQLIVSTTDSVFSSPTPGAFVSGDDVVVMNFSSNTFAGGAGFTANDITFSLAGGVSAGDQILLRWWPTLTTANTSPSAGDMFGQFRTSVVENSSDTGWFVPAEGQTIALNFKTTQFGGTEPDAAGEADFTVAAIPEPSTFALLIAGAVGFLAMRRRTKI